MKLEFFERLAELIPSIVYIFDVRERKMTYFNRRGAEMLGYQAAEILHWDSFRESFVLPEYFEAINSSQQRLLAGSSGIWESIEIQVQHRSGHRIWLLLERTIFERDEHGIPLLLLGVGTDITEKKSAEAKLQRAAAEMEQRQQFLSALLDALPDPIFVKDAQHRWIYVNKGFNQLLGKSTEELLGKSDHDLFPKEMADVFWSKDEEVFRSGLVNVNEEFVLDAAGKLRTIVTTKAPSLSADGKSLLIGIIRDVTDDREKELKIERSEHRLREAHRIAEIGSWEFDVTNKKIYWSPEYFRMFGLDPAHNAPTHSEFLAMVHPDDLPFMQAPIETRYAGSAICDMPLKIVRPSGEVRHLSKRVEVERKDGKIVRLRGVATDVTERKRIEQVVEDQRLKIVSSSKMSALGEMSAGLAHEINNPLAIIHGKACQLGDMARAGKLETRSVEQFAGKIEQTSMRIARIVKGLRSFARDADADPMQKALVRTILDDTLDLCRSRFIHHDITLKLSEFPSDLQMECRAVEISQVLLNLLNNSFDAVEGTSLERWIQVDAVQRGEWVDIAISDSGRGILPEVRLKIMQPFFTTKEVGKGTGLGLSISKGIIESHGGHLELDERMDRTRFVISLPSLQTSRA